jgi:hypothetical protein
MARSQASGQETVWLHAGESCVLSFPLASPAAYSLQVRYTNDNFGPLETITVQVNGNLVGQIMALDTGDFGTGWNVFLWSSNLGPAALQPGNQQISVGVNGGDGFGTEIDLVRLALVP